MGSALRQVNSVQELREPQGRQSIERRPPYSQIEVLEFLEQERNLIVSRMNGYDAKAIQVLTWYLECSTQWGITHLNELAKLPPGTLLDIGTHSGLIAGTAYRMGWDVSISDFCPPPTHSGLLEPSRQIQIKIANACLEPIPYADNAFTVVLLSEVLEHLTYSPKLLFSEIRRVLKPGGFLFLSTPNPGHFPRLWKLARGENPTEPSAGLFLAENDTFVHKGLTFFKSGREARLWTKGEIETYLLQPSGLELDTAYYFGSTAEVEKRKSVWTHVRNFIRRFFSKSLLVGGGSLFLKARKPD